MKRTLWILIAVFLVGALVLAACGGQQATKTAPAATTQPTKASQAQPTQAPKEQPTPTKQGGSQKPSAKPLTFGILLVGPYNDHGWSQAHYEAAQIVAKKLNAKMLYVDKVNPSDRPGTTAEQLADDLVSKGAKVIIFNSDDMKDAALEFAQSHPDIYVIHASGDNAWKEGKDYKNLPNLSNVMGKMIYGKMIAGCAAAMTTQTGKIGYLGPLINDETRRLASSAYLGAKYCWEHYRNKDPKDLQFKVTWIGFWFNIPGVTSDPTQVADEFYNNGYDVVLSGIDTTEALVEAKKFHDQGKKVYAVPYDFKEACEEAPDVCLGVPYFNWVPGYTKLLKSVQDGTWKSTFLWLGPDWKDINNPDTSSVGFEPGKALTGDAADAVQKFEKELASGLNLWKGPLKLQDGKVYLKDGEVATDQQIWYLPQLLEGMEGQSVPQK